MITAGLILATLSALGFIIVTIIEVNDNDGSGIFTFFGWCCGALFSLGLCMAIVESDREKKPAAMDVYQGKTTLEYTIVDGVVKDSTVVWKDVRS